MLPPNAASFAHVEADTSTAGRRASRFSWSLAVEAVVVVALPVTGVFCPQGSAMFYSSLLLGLLGIAGVVLAGASLVSWRAEARTVRLQGPRRRPAQMLRGARDTTLAAFIAACLLAWPLSRLRSGAATGLTWSIAEAGGATRVVLQTVAALFVLDAWLYWKHRLLHTRRMFAFHRAHHVYRDPTALASFAVGPVESLLTFWPVVIWAHPKAVHWIPLYWALVAGFVALNFYLHCGIAVRILERVLPRLFINTSSFHNRHHANADVNFGEALTLWDRICGTAEGRTVAAEVVLASRSEE